VPRGDLSPFTARQMLNFKDKAVADKLNRVWGAIRQPAQDKTVLLARYKGARHTRNLGPGGPRQRPGHLRRTCAGCHKLFDEGARIGPELTGAQRTNPEYILIKVLDPNAVVSREFQVTSISTQGGRVIHGLVREENDKALALQTPTELIRLPKSEIEERRATAAIADAGRNAREIEGRRSTRPVGVPGRTGASTVARRQGRTDGRQPKSRVIGRPEVMGKGRRSVSVNQGVGLEPESVQDRGGEVLGANGQIADISRMAIAGAIGLPAADAAAGEHLGIAKRPMIATDERVSLSAYGQTPRRPRSASPPADHALANLPEGPENARSKDGMQYS